MPRSDSTGRQSTTSPIAQTLASMISVGVTGITSRCSMVPCSRSRISAAPVRTMDSMVTLLIISISEPNQARWSACRVEAHAQRARSTGGTCTAAVALDEFGHLAHHDLLDVAAAGEGLAHARGVHIELDAPARARPARRAGSSAGCPARRCSARHPARIHLGQGDAPGGMKAGGRRRRVMRADSGESSSSTIAMGTVLSVPAWPWRRCRPPP
jgi:hypothetical protein